MLFQIFCKNMCSTVSQLLLDSSNIVGTQFLSLYRSNSSLKVMLFAFPIALIVLSKTCQQSEARQVTIKALTHISFYSYKAFKAHGKTLVSFYLVNLPSYLFSLAFSY